MDSSVGLLVPFVMHSVGLCLNRWFAFVAKCEHGMIVDGLSKIYIIAVVLFAIRIEVIN